jgi:acyl dehydratase
MSQPTEGEIHTSERTFTAEDVRRFVEVSEDEQPRHTEEDDEGRLMVHGLLTATLPTKIGGSLEVLARRMEFEFVAPVYTGDVVTCVWTNESAEERDGRYDFTVDVVCENNGGDTVLTADIEGVVLKESDRQR